jgi:hypothetical protein
MKKNYIHLFSAILMLLFASTTLQSYAQVNDSVKMNNGYAKEVYYSFHNGVVDTVPRASWDIAFRTPKVSSSILINDGAGVVLWVNHNADTAGWTNFDTTGLHTWKPMYNDTADWENGAFSRHATGHPDYGWGVYNSVTHDLVGDSIFVIKLRNGSYRKILIERKNSVNDIYYIRYANLDGTNPHLDTLDLTPYLTANKEFVGYSLQTSQFVDYQPVKTSWDIVFTKYMSIHPNGTPYIYVGVLNNPAVKSNKFFPVPSSYMGWSTVTMDSTRSPIGWSWKQINMATYIYYIQDSTVFFVRDQQHDIYKLVFTRFEGTSTGKICFTKTKVSSAGIASVSNPVTQLEGYPNPAKDHVTLCVTRQENANALLSVYDITGNLVKSSSQEIKGKTKNFIPLDLNNLTNGVYMLKLVSGTETMTKKLVIQK